MVSAYPSRTLASSPAVLIVASTPDSGASIIGSPDRHGNSHQNVLMAVAADDRFCRLSKAFYSTVKGSTTPSEA